MRLNSVNNFKFRAIMSSTFQNFKSNKFQSILRAVINRKHILKSQIYINGPVYSLLLFLKLKIEKINRDVFNLTNVKFRVT